MANYKVSETKFFSTQTSPTNWSLDKAVKLRNEKKHCSAVCLSGVATLSFVPSSLKNVVCVIVKIPVTVFALTVGQIPPVKARTWSKLENVDLVASSAARTLFALGIHVYKTVMFIAFSPLCCVFVGFISPSLCKAAHDFLRLTAPQKSDEKIEENPQANKDPEPLKKPNKKTDEQNVQDNKPIEKENSQQAVQTVLNPNPNQDQVVNGVVQAALENFAKKTQEKQQENQATDAGVMNPAQAHELPKQEVVQGPPTTRASQRFSTKVPTRPVSVKGPLNLLDTPNPVNPRASVSRPLPPPPLNLDLLKSSEVKPSSMLDLSGISSTKLKKVDPNAVQPKEKEVEGLNKVFSSDQANRFLARAQDRKVPPPSTRKSVQVTDEEWELPANNDPYDEPKNRLESRVIPTKQTETPAAPTSTYSNEPLKLIKQLSHKVNTPPSAENKPEDSIKKQPMPAWMLAVADKRKGWGNTADKDELAEVKKKILDDLPPEEVSKVQKKNNRKSVWDIYAVNPDEDEEEENATKVEPTPTTQQTKQTEVKVEVIPAKPQAVVQIQESIKKVDDKVLTLTPQQQIVTKKTKDTSLDLKIKEIGEKIKKKEDELGKLKSKKKRNETEKSQIKTLNKNLKALRKKEAKFREEKDLEDLYNIETEQKNQEEPVQQPVQVEPIRQPVPTLNQEKPKAQTLVQTKEPVQQTPEKQATIKPAQPVIEQKNQTLSTKDVPAGVEQNSPIQDAEKSSSKLGSVGSKSKAVGRAQGMGFKIVNRTQS